MAGIDSDIVPTQKSMQSAITGIFQNGGHFEPEVKFQIVINQSQYMFKLLNTDSC